MLRSYLNGYAYSYLSESEGDLFDRYFNADDETHREFCQLFGPEKIPENLGGFLGDFMVRKVIAGSDFKRAGGTVTRKLSRWLVERAYIGAEDGLLGAQEEADAARNLPRAEKAADLLAALNDSSFIDPDHLKESEYRDFDHYTIARIRSGKIWFTDFGNHGKRTLLGPVSIPRDVTKLLEEGWDVSCSLARVRGAWRLLEVGNVYPR